MPQDSWSAKRERQYEHIKGGLEERGETERTAEEIAARTVNKERARAGESERSSRTSIDDIVIAAWRVALTPWSRRTYPGSALRGGPPARHRGAF